MDPLEPILNLLIAAIPQEKLKVWFEQLGLSKGCSGFLVGSIVVMIVACFIGSCWLVLWIFGLWGKWP
jgi:hypothetical protein